MTGRVNAALDAVLPVEVYGANGQTTAYDAVIDTGFNGFLTLPAHAIQALVLPLAGYVDAILGDGSPIELGLFRARVRWNRTDRAVHVLEAEGGPLVGTALLRNFQLRVHFVQGGAVTVTRPD